MLFRENETQWMVMVVLLFYFVLLSSLEARSKKFALAGFKVFEPKTWLIAFLTIVLMRYAFAYKTASHTVQPLMLFAGVVFGKAVKCWAMIRQVGSGGGVTYESRQIAGSPCYKHARESVALMLLLLVDISALWQPKMSAVYQYRGIQRWSGVFDNPNWFGILMGIGVVFGIGLFLSSLKTRKWELGFIIVSAMLCVVGLFKSYSRGAWLGTAIGLAYLFPIFRSLHFNSETAAWRWIRINRISLFVILLSLLVLTFWECRFTDWRPARRVFSVGNVDDFSWRNRVDVWKGEAQMMMGHPLLGFGWGEAETAFQQNYSSLHESAAIQMNDFLMIGVSSGIPAMLCFVAYIALSFRKSLTQYGSPTSMIYCAGTTVLFIGFWFDGGLFKLSVGPIFWAVIEMAPAEDRTVQKAPTVKQQSTWKPISPISTWLRLASGVFAIAAIILTALELCTPLFNVNEKSVTIARRLLVPRKEKADFDYMAFDAFWSGKSLKTLLEHVHLANYNRQLVNWELDDKIYREFVLSPQIDPLRDGELRWRRPLWEFFYPCIRKETELFTATIIVRQKLAERIKVSDQVQKPGSVEDAWHAQQADKTGFEVLFVASLRSTGIPARLGTNGLAETLRDGKWHAIRE